MKELIQTFNYDIWSIDYEYANQLVEHLENRKPKTILDLGSGNTTRIFDRYASVYGGDVYSIEGNQQFIDILKPDLTQQVHLMLFPYIHQMGGESKYLNLDSWISDSGMLFDLVSVDGPYGFGCEKPRTNILDILKSGKISVGGEIFLHDTDRAGESWLADEIQSLGCQLIYTGARFKIFKTLV